MGPNFSDEEMTRSSSQSCIWPILGLAVLFNVKLREVIIVKRKSNQKQNAGFGMSHKFHHAGIKLRTFSWASANDSSSSEALLNKRLHGLSFKEKKMLKEIFQMRMVSRCEHCSSRCVEAWGGGVRCLTCLQNEMEKQLSATGESRTRGREMKWEKRNPS